MLNGFCLINILEGSIFITWNYHLNSCSKVAWSPCIAIEFTGKTAEHTKEKRKSVVFLCNTSFFPRYISGVDSIPILWEGRLEVSEDTASYKNVIKRTHSLFIWAEDAYLVNTKITTEIGRADLCPVLHGPFDKSRYHTSTKGAENFRAIVFHAA